MNALKDKPEAVKRKGSQENSEVDKPPIAAKPRSERGSDSKDEETRQRLSSGSVQEHKVILEKKLSLESPATMKSVGPGPLPADKKPSVTEPPKPDGTKGDRLEHHVPVASDSDYQLASDPSVSSSYSEALPLATGTAGVGVYSEAQSIYALPQNARENGTVKVKPVRKQKRREASYQEIDFEPNSPEGPPVPTKTEESTAYAYADPDKPDKWSLQHVALGIQKKKRSSEQTNSSPYEYAEAMDMPNPASTDGAYEDVSGFKGDFVYSSME